MYSTCLFCNSALGTNDQIAAFPVGHRLAYDPARGRLWAICARCGRWNLSPLEERWEAIDECERLFRGTRLRYSTDNIGLARVGEHLELVRIGPALLPEIASWRYGSKIEQHTANTNGKRPVNGLVRRSTGLPRWLARRAAAALAGYATTVGLSDEAMLRLRTFRRGDAVLARTIDDRGSPIVIRYAHLGGAELIRPDRDAPWRLVVRHDGGISRLAEGVGLRTAGKMLASLNFGVASNAEVQHAIAKLDEAGDRDGYFTRVASLAMRTHWGRVPDAPDEGLIEPAGSSFAERIALQLANRSFWGRGGTGSEETTPLFRLPAVDRLALEMASNEDIERRALEGELTSLAEAWREAEEIARISDELFADEVFDEFKRQYTQRVSRADES
ncbi:MAG TPA: hypothetical protein VJW73_04110, partial [Gemmatimonadaceae bacterium]|nr:hypothetical protein [Gemmatimonadaceae bacterium]